MIETIIAVAALCVKAVELVVRSESTGKEVKRKCEDIGRRVKTLQSILPGYSSAAASDDGTAAALRALKAALRHARKVIESCSASRGLTKLVAAEERIETCMIRDLELAARARRVHQSDIVTQQQQQPTTTVIHNHQHNLHVGHVGTMNLVMHQGGAMASSGGSSSRAQMQQRHPTEMTTTAAAATRTTHAAPAASSSDVVSGRHRGAPGPATTTSNAAAAASSSTTAIVSSSAAAAIVASSSANRRQLVIDNGGHQPRDDGLAALANDGRPRTRSASRATRTPAPTAARAAPSAPPPPPPPPVAPPLRRSNTSSSRIRPPREPRAPRELDSGGTPQQRATARPSRR